MAIDQETKNNITDLYFKNRLPIRKIAKVTCEIFIKWDMIWCPCCGYRLRTRPRNSIFKKRFATVKKYQGLKNKIQASIPVRY